MTAGHILLYLRFVELAVLVGAIFWVIWTQPPCPYRTKRLTVAYVLLAIDIAAILVCVFWLRVNPW